MKRKATRSLTLLASLFLLSACTAEQWQRYHDARAQQGLTGPVSPIYPSQGHLGISQSFTFMDADGSMKQCFATPSSLQCY